MPTIISHAAVPLALGLGLGPKRVPRALLIAGIVASMREEDSEICPTPT